MGCFFLFDHSDSIRISANQWMLIVFVFFWNGVSDLNKSNSTWHDTISKEWLWWREKDFYVSHRQRSLCKTSGNVWLTIHLIYRLRKRCDTSVTSLIYRFKGKLIQFLKNRRYTEIFRVHYYIHLFLFISSNKKHTRYYSVM